MTYAKRVLALTPDFAKLSISPESSDGFASVGTILPKEEAALLPGGLFVFLQSLGERRWCLYVQKIGRPRYKKSHHSIRAFAVPYWPALVSFARGALPSSARPLLSMRCEIKRLKRLSRTVSAFSFAMKVSFAIDYFARWRRNR
jgi:hypothetical protein